MLKKVLFKNFKRLFWWFRSLNIRYQLVYSYIPIVFVSLLVFGIISYEIVSETLERNSRAFAGQTVNVLSSDINKKLAEYEKISTTIALDYDLYNLLSDERSDLDYYLKYEQVKNKLAYIIENDPDIRSIFVYPANNSMIIKSNSNIYFNDLDYKQTEIYKKAAENNRIKLWSIRALGTYAHTSKRFLFLHRSIPTISGSSGIIQLQIYEDCLYDIYKDTTFSKGSTMFISDPEGLIVSHQDKTRIGSRMEATLLDGMEGNKGTFTVKLSGVSYLVVYTTLDSVPWRLVATIPMDFITVENGRILSASLIMILLTFIFTVTVTALVSSGIIKPLEKIGSSMQRIEQGDFDILLNYEGDNEIGNISKRFNAMTNEIKNLMDIIRKEEKEKKEAYIQVLQAQIKPHFLYNTLFTIKCLASVKKQPEIEELLDSLVSLLMASINRSGEFVEVCKEIEYIKSYILIQSYRYVNKFEITYDIDPQIEEATILKLLLQPIVENSLLHGIEKGDKPLMISIRGRIEEGDIVFRIRDDGKGMDVDRVHALLNAGKEEYKNVFSGIGVRNVNERIRLYFGEPYGLRYSKDISEGTEAIIRLPFINDEGSAQNNA